jgi:hypothetical protein
MPVGVAMSPRSSWSGAGRRLPAAHALGRRQDPRPGPAQQAGQHGPRPAPFVHATDDSTEMESRVRYRPLVDAFRAGALRPPFASGRFQRIAGNVVPPSSKTLAPSPRGRRFPD